MKILVVDDHGLIREALRGVLSELRSEAVILEAENARWARHRIEEHSDVDLVLLDLGLPDGDGFDVLAELRERAFSAAVVVFSASRERDDIVRALELGAVGFIPKSARREVMLGALELVFAGGIYVPPEILDILPAPAATPPASAPVAVPAARSGVTTGSPHPAALSRVAAGLGITERQREVLALMMQGKSNKAICRELDIAEPTVKNHVTALLRVLEASNRTEAVIAATALLHESFVEADARER